MKWFFYIFYVNMLAMENKLYIDFLQSSPLHKPLTFQLLKLVPIQKMYYIYILTSI